MPVSWLLPMISDIPANVWIKFCINLITDKGRFQFDRYGRWYMGSRSLFYRRFHGCLWSWRYRRHVFNITLTANIELFPKGGSTWYVVSCVSPVGMEKCWCRTVFVYEFVTSFNQPTGGNIIYCREINNSAPYRNLSIFCYINVYPCRYSS